MIPPFVNIERALHDFKRGIPVILQDKTASLLIATADNLLPFVSDLFISRQGYLILSQRRAAYLYHPGPDSAIALPWTNGTQEELPKLLWTQDHRSGYQPRTTYEPATSLQQTGLNTAVLTQTLPGILCTSLLTPDDYDTYLTLSADALFHYEDSYATQLGVACTAPLVLERNITGSITAFTAPGSAKEHYAICIGSLASMPSVPIVRLHSSCYTGDLLASITCDCRDQLHTAITQIAEQGGGIILYLMQEGRNIGLINKLRAYALKDTGLDTVEANYALGFEDDVRHFQAAARMLQLLGHTNIALLTNNPKKANSLTDYGITVSRTIPHKTDVHAHNQDYLSTKVERLGHTP